jgi:hypothetical protein
MEKTSSTDNRSMSYELWDIETRNIIGTFESEAQALHATRDLIARNAPAYPDALALVFEDDQGESSLIVKGPRLASRAAAHS